MKHAQRIVMLISLAVSTTNSFAAPFRTVILTSAHAQGTEDGVVFSLLGSPSLNNSGYTAFRGGLAGSGVDSTNDFGIWSERDNGELALIAREGSSAPGAGHEEVFYGFGNPTLNDLGQTAFLAELTGVGISNVDNTGIWSEGGGRLGLVARTGDVAPGTGGLADYKTLGTLVLNDAGHVAFRGELVGAGIDFTNDEGIWSEGSGNGLALIARRGAPAPDTEEGVTFSDFHEAGLNSKGEVVFWAGLTGPGITGNNSNGIWLGNTSGGLNLAVRSGDAAQGTGESTRFAQIFRNAFNDEGETTFSSSLVGGGVRDSNDTGLWKISANGELTLIARKGEAAPGTESGTEFSFFSPAIINHGGSAAFHSHVSGEGVDSTNNRGIWKENEDGELTLVARKGNQAPGTPSGVTFGDFIVNRLVLNRRGQIAFMGLLTGVDVNSSNDLGIWIEDLSGDLQLIAREGDMLDVDDGPGVDYREISSVHFFGDTGNEDGLNSAFNDHGQLAFWASFTDGSNGIFVSGNADVPEPTSGLLGVVSAFAVVVHRRFRVVR